MMPHHMFTLQSSSRALRVDETQASSGCQAGRVGTPCFSTVPSTCRAHRSPGSPPTPHGTTDAPSSPDVNHKKERGSRGTALRNVVFSQEIYLTADKGPCGKQTSQRCACYHWLAPPLSALSLTHTHASEDTTLENSLPGDLLSGKHPSLGPPSWLPSGLDTPRSCCPSKWTKAPNVAHKYPREIQLLRQAGFGDFLGIVTPMLRTWEQSLTSGPVATSANGSRSGGQSPPGPGGVSSPSRPPRPTASQKDWSRDSICPAPSPRKDVGECWKINKQLLEEF